METKPTTYTVDFVLEELRNMLSEIKSDVELIYKGQLFETRKYSPKRFSEWASNFSSLNPVDSEGKTVEITEEEKDKRREISETIDQIEQILENRAVVGGLKNKLNASITKFHLMNNFNWKEKTDSTNSLVIDDTGESMREIAKHTRDLVKANTASPAPR